MFQLRLKGLVKIHMHDLFEQWYSYCITTQLAQDIDVDHIINIECGFRSIKVLHAKWIIKLLVHTTF